MTKKNTLLAELRDEAIDLENYGSDRDAYGADLCRRAADEIERLTQPSEWSVMLGQIQSMAAEIERLREAEHRARCDLIDALAIMGCIWDVGGPTESEARCSQEWHDKTAARYPQMKGQWPPSPEVANERG